MKNHFLFMTLTICWGITSAQPDFACQAQLETVPEDGFYRVLIKPEFTSYLKSNVSDIKIFHKDQEAPYLMKKENQVVFRTLFREYEILEKTYKKGCCTQLILHNVGKKKINNISLFISNAKVQKELVLTGSNDKKTWFSVKSSHPIFSIENNLETSEIKVLDFPLSDYEYFRINIRDSVSAPIQIIKAGYYDTQSEDGKYSNCAPLQVHQQDSLKAKQTYVKLLFNHPSLISRIDFQISGPQLYYRKARLCSLEVYKSKNGLSREVYRTIMNLDLISDNRHSFIIPELKTTELFLIIENEDNPPLNVEDAKAFLLNHYLIAYLEQGKEYSLKMGNPDLPPSKYDLRHFKDSIPDQPHLLESGKVTILPEKASEKISSTFGNSAFMWSAIGLIVLLMGFFSVKMIREMS